MLAEVAEGARGEVRRRADRALQRRRVEIVYGAEHLVRVGVGVGVGVGFGSGSGLGLGLGLGSGLVGVGVRVRLRVRLCGAAHLLHVRVAHGHAHVPPPQRARLDRELHIVVVAEAHEAVGAAAYLDGEVRLAAEEAPCDARRLSAHAGHVGDAAANPAQRVIRAEVPPGWSRAMVSIAMVSIAIGSRAPGWSRAMVSVTLGQAPEHKP